MAAKCSSHKADIHHSSCFALIQPEQSSGTETIETRGVEIFSKK